LHSAAGKGSLGRRNQKHEEEELSQAVAEMQTLLSSVPDKEIIKAVRESRNQR